MQRDVRIVEHLRCRLEELDLPSGAGRAGVAVDAAAEPVDRGPVAQLGGLPGVELAGVVRDLDGWRQSGYRDLRELPAAEQVSTFHCVTGWTVHDVRWRGIRLQHILDLVSPRPSAHAPRFVSSEHPYEDSLTIEQALLPDVMLALDLDGSPLSRPHGAPLRLVIPEMYGYKGVKWLERIEVVAQQPTGFWENLGYDQDAWVGRSNGYD